MTNRLLQPTRRNIELGLIVLAWVIGTLGTLIVGWATGEAVPGRFFVNAAVVAVLAVAMHIVVRWKAAYADPLMLPVATLLTIMGLIIIYRLDVLSAGYECLSCFIHNLIIP